VPHYLFEVEYTHTFTNRVVIFEATQSDAEERIREGYGGIVKCGSDDTRPVVKDMTFLEVRPG
jgi:hypothetical protein